MGASKRILNRVGDGAVAVGSRMFLGLRVFVLGSWAGFSVLVKHGGLTS